MKMIFAILIIFIGTNVYATSFEDTINDYKEVKTITPVTYNSKAITAASDLGKLCEIAGYKVGLGFETHSISHPTKWIRVYAANDGSALSLRQESLRPGEYEIHNVYKSITCAR